MFEADHETRRNSEAYTPAILDGFAALWKEFVYCSEVSICVYGARIGKRLTMGGTDLGEKKLGQSFVFN